MKKSAALLLLLFALVLTHAQVPNSGMELWDSQPVLLNWQTNSHPLTLPVYDPYIVKKDTDAYSGNWAANFYGNGFFKPWGTTQLALQQHPQSLSLFYKLTFAPCVNDANYTEKDTVAVLIEILYQGAPVDTGYWQSTISQLTYTNLTIPVTQHSTVFDSCRITITGGKNFGGCGIVATPTQFKVDELQLNYAAACIDTSIICAGCPCPAVVDPVCGCNNVTYGNSCEAQKQGVTRWTAGPCYVPGNCHAQFFYTKNFDSITFYNQSAAANITAYNWSFGDEFYSPVQNPTHRYTYEGTFTVCLNITGTDSSGSIC